MANSPTLTQAILTLDTRARELNLSSGCGRYVLLGCKDQTTSIRHTRHFQTAEARDHTYYKWDRFGWRCPHPLCHGEHIRVDLPADDQNAR
jgi:hypothetical protein